MATTQTIEVTGFLAEDLQSIKLEHPAVMRRVFQPWAGKRLTLKVAKHTRRRTEQQNRYIHGPVVNTVRSWMIETEGEDYGHDYVYTFLRTLVGHRVEVKVMHGVEIVAITGKRFSRMTTVEFNKAIEEIKRHFAKKGLDIPEPRGENFWGDYDGYKALRDE